MLHHLITTGLDDLMEEEKADEDIEGGKDEHHNGNEHLLCVTVVELVGTMCASKQTYKE